MSDTGMDLTIRRAVPADAELLADLGARTFREAFAADNSPEDMALYVSKAYGVPQQRTELANPGITTLLADVDGSLAGYAQLRANAAPECVGGTRALELWRFYVAAPWHGRGVARALMDSVVMEARARQAETLWLAVWERNERAKAFYRKCGFVDAGAQVFVLGTDVQSDRVMARSIYVQADD
jgi:ribosomal protein S18 acetylase RimI-like enzyme